MPKPCEGKEWEDLIDALVEMEFRRDPNSSDEEYNEQLNEFIAAAGFDPAEALAKLQVEDDKAWANFASQAVVITV